MDIQLTFKHIGSDDLIKEYATTKSQRLKKYFRGRISVIWNFNIEKQNHIAHCRLVGNQMDYFGEAITDGLQSSIDIVIDKIEKQIKKHKEIVKDHH